MTDAADREPPGRDADQDHRPIILDLSRCSGCGACAEVRPDLFACDDETGHAVQLVHGAPAEAVREAMAWCPKDCIGMGEPEAGSDS